MPKAQRHPEEIEAIRENILNHAVNLMTTEGYHNFSMRKLATPLGIAAKTIYNYYRNKDELYLAILTKGFEKLYAACLNTYNNHAHPLKRADAMLATFLNFGLEEPNFYNLMFIWHVPKYNDYVGTAMEPTARMELETALQAPQLFIRAIRECANPAASMSEEEGRIIMIYLWTQLHGFIAGINNTLMDYMHENPMALKKKMLQRIRDSLRNELKRYRKTVVVDLHQRDAANR